MRHHVEAKLIVSIMGQGVCSIVFNGVGGRFKAPVLVTGTVCALNKSKSPASILVRKSLEWSNDVSYAC